MSASDSLGLQFKYYDQAHRGWRGVDAHLGEHVVGAIQWATEHGDGDVGEIQHIEVDEEHRRKGIATALLQQARERDPRVKHSTNVTAAGRVWARARP